MTLYTCTVSRSCGSSFDRYGDWCHHEATAHRCPFNVWYCTELPASGPYLCDKGFRSREEFEAHRARDHNGSGACSNDYFLGPALGALFYCGFCQSAYPAHGLEWWRARAEHLREHFEAENTMADWVDIEMQ